VIFMRIKYNSLPKEVQHAVDKIRKHRLAIIENGALYGSFPAILLAAVNAPEIELFHKSTGSRGIAHVGVALLAGGLVPALRGHSRQTREEYLHLFRVLKNLKNFEPLEQLSKKCPYLVVGLNGDLIGKKRNPVVLRTTLGFRRTPMPKTKARLVARWRKKTFPR